MVSIFYPQITVNKCFHLYRRKNEQDGILALPGWCYKKNCRLRDSFYNSYHIQLCHCVNFLGHTANFSGVCILLINSLGCSAAHLSLECVKR